MAVPRRCCVLRCCRRWWLALSPCLTRAHPPITSVSTRWWTTWVVSCHTQTYASSKCRLHAGHHSHLVDATHNSLALWWRLTEQSGSECQKCVPLEGSVQNTARVLSAYICSLDSLQALLNHGGNFYFLAVESNAYVA